MGRYALSTLCGCAMPMHDMVNGILLLPTIIYLFFLPPCNWTGILDSETASWMSMPRCGVKDKVGLASTNRRKRYAHQGTHNFPAGI